VDKSNQKASLEDSENRADIRFRNDANEAVDLME
jgi:hypothetical protein